MAGEYVGTTLFMLCCLGGTQLVIFCVLTITLLYLALTTTVQCCTTAREVRDGRLVAAAKHFQPVNRLSPLNLIVSNNETIAFTFPCPLGSH